MSTNPETTTRPTDAPLDRARELHAWVAAGRIDDAMRAFYADEVVMRENNEQPVVGLPANLEREQAFVDSVAEWTGYTVHALTGDASTTLAEIEMEFVGKDGSPVRIEQASVARWKDGKIVSERFYHG